jgi:pilus assembly protein CpaB
MKRKRIWIALVLAAVSGVAAGYLALNYFQRPTLVPSSANASTTPVAVAARDLPIGSVLSREDLEMVEWPTGAVPQNYSRSAEEVVGRGLITPVSKGEPLLASKLAQKEAGGGLPIVIPEGMRAVSVKVDEVIGVAGFVLPGTRVDVLVTLDSDESGGTGTRVILQNVTALAAGQTIQRDQEGKPQTVTVITLLVTPEDAEKLTLASTEGRIQLALRNMLDQKEVETEGIRAGNLIRQAEAQPERPARPARRRSNPQPRYGVEVFNGTDRSVTVF